MGIDLEIMLGKDEREFRKNVNIIVESIFNGVDTTLTESALVVKYNETAEMLREYNYTEKIVKILKEGELDEFSKNRLSIVIGENVKDIRSAMITTREVIDYALMMTESSDLDNVKDAYTKLAEVRELFEAPEYFYNPENGGKKEELRNHLGQPFEKGEVKNHNGIAYSKGGRMWITHSNKDGNYATDPKTNTTVKLNWEDKKPEPKFFNKDERNRSSNTIIP